MSHELWKWIAADGTEQQATLSELRTALDSGTLAPTAPVWRAGETARRTAREVASMGASAPPTFGEVPPPPLAVLAVQRAFESKASESFAPPPVVPNSGTVRSAPPPAADVEASSGPETLATTIGVPALDPATLRAHGLPVRPAPVADESVDVARAPGLAIVPVIKGLWSDLSSDVRAVAAGQRPASKKRLLVAGVAAGSACLLVLVALVRGCSGSDEATAKVEPASSLGGAAASAHASAAPPSTDKGTPSAVPEPAAKVATASPAPSSSAGCVVGGSSRVVASAVRISSGFELGASPSTLALAFASSAVDAVAVSVDPLTLSLRSMARARSAHGDIKRVTPLLAGERFVPSIDADRRRDRLSLRRVVPTDPPIDLGIEGSHVVATTHGQSDISRLFALSGAGATDMVRGVPLANEPGVALALRRGSTIFVGLARGSAGELHAVGELGRIEGAGQVGQPSVAANDRTIMVAWSERATADDPWQVRFTTMDVATGALSAQVPKVLEFPAGGPGQAAMSPALAPLSGDRFVLAWTEGPIADHEVRAMAMSSRGERLGMPLTLSRPGINAGQPRVVVAADGHGAVAFLEESGKSFDLIAAPIACP